jgi:hypothetical protein
MKQLGNVLVLSAASFLFCMGAPGSAKSSGNGISALIAVTQLKAQNASEDANSAADKQREAIKNEKLASKQAHLRELATLNEKHARNYALLAKQLKAVQLKLKKLNCK